LNNIHRGSSFAVCSSPGNDKQIGPSQALHHQTSAMLLTAKQHSKQIHFIVDTKKQQLPHMQNCITVSVVCI